MHLVEDGPGVLGFSSILACAKNDHSSSLPTNPRRGAFPTQLGSAAQAPEGRISRVSPQFSPPGQSGLLCINECLPLWSCSWSVLVCASDPLEIVLHGRNRGKERRKRRVLPKGDTRAPMANPVQRDRKRGKPARSELRQDLSCPVNSPGKMFYTARNFSFILTEYSTSFVVLNFYCFLQVAELVV